MRYVLIADDHEVTRRGIREVLCDAHADVQISEVADMPSVIEQLDAQPWDLVLLDVMMPGGNIIDLIRQIRDLRPTLPVLVLTAALETEYVIQTLKAGANGLIHKHRAAEELLQAIQTVIDGQRYLDSDSAMALATSLLTTKPVSVHEKLSARELETLLRIARGQSIKEIAADLDLSDKTVATYVSRIREKTGLSSHVEIARYALLHKLVD